jgi:hypothetical protein
MKIMRLHFVDPPGLEPGLCGTKIRRVANYTMGQSNLIRRCKIRKKNQFWNALQFLTNIGLPSLLGRKAKNKTIKFVRSKIITTTF